MNSSGNGTPVWRYTEHQLQRVEYDDSGVGIPVPTRDSAPQLVVRLLAAEGPMEREALVRGMLHSIGFEWFAYGVNQLQRGRCLTKSFFTTYAHPQWTQRYFGEHHNDVDPRHLDAPRSGLPLVWDLADIDARLSSQALTPRGRRFTEDFRDSGIRSGVFFQLPSAAAANERVVISLMSSTPGRAWIVESVLGRALTLGLCMHEFLSQHVRPVGPPTPAQKHLSSLQQRILECLCRGQSDKEIAHGLQLSTHAVDYHMRQLRKRFSVRNRVELVNAAAMH